jgi:hypothetical protein
MSAKIIVVQAPTVDGSASWRSSMTSRANAWRWCPTRIINPKTAASQFRGGMIMGMGMALMEETQFDERNGRIMNPSLAEYHVPVHMDVPRSLNTERVCCHGSAASGNRTSKRNSP